MSRMRSPPTALRQCVISTLPEEAEQIFREI
jgi:hypothetical protein